jgi:hypothetical protein
MKRLMLDYAFRFVDDSVIFLVEIDNIRSEKAMRKVGRHFYWAPRSEDASRHIF